METFPTWDGESPVPLLERVTQARYNRPLSLLGNAIAGVVGCVEPSLRLSGLLLEVVERVRCCEIQRAGDEVWPKLARDTF